MSIISLYMRNSWKHLIQHKLKSEYQLLKSEKVHERVIVRYVARKVYQCYTWFAGDSFLPRSRKEEFTRYRMNKKFYSRNMCHTHTAFNTFVLHRKFTAELHFSELFRLEGMWSQPERKNTGYNLGRSPPLAKYKKIQGLSIIFGYSSECCWM